jgi:hypothetical protein
MDTLKQFQTEGQAVFEQQIEHGHSLPTWPFLPCGCDPSRLRIAEQRSARPASDKLVQAATVFASLRSVLTVASSVVRDCGS